MPAVSQAQFRLMQGIAHGMTPPPGMHMDPSKAKEYVQGVNYQSLPKKKKLFSKATQK